MRIRYFAVLLFFVGGTALGQELVEIQGVVKASEDVEGIHILNKTSNLNAVTNEAGKFIISAKLNDTLLVSSIKYFAKQVMVDEALLTSRQLTIQLEILVNELDEVTVGKILTGDLISDLENAEVKRDINFYDLGIPGNTNLPITQNERRVEEADHGKFFYYYGIGFAINVNKILNRVSGRTKRLKHYVALEKRDKCMERASYAFADILFKKENHLEEEIVAFFFFASEDPAFKEVCLVNNDMAMYQFLSKKREVFLENLGSAEIQD